MRAANSLSGFGLGKECCTAHSVVSINTLIGKKGEETHERSSLVGERRGSDTHHTAPSTSRPPPLPLATHPEHTPLNPILCSPLASREVEKGVVGAEPAEMDNGDREEAGTRAATHNT